MDVCYFCMLKSSRDKVFVVLMSRVMCATINTESDDTDLSPYLLPLHSIPKLIITCIVTSCSLFVDKYVSDIFFDGFINDSFFSAKRSKSCRCLKFCLRQNNLFETKQSVFRKITFTYFSNLLLLVFSYIDGETLDSCHVVFISHYNILSGSRFLGFRRVERRVSYYRILQRAEATGPVDKRARRERATAEKNSRREVAAREVRRREVARRKREALEIVRRARVTAGERGALSLTSSRPSRGSLITYSR